MAVKLTVILIPAILLAACGTAIGDECSNDAQCPTGAYCDKTMPDGMCTVADCREGDCPEESVCVEFPNHQSFCMASCSEDGDCREGYSCIEEIGPSPFCSVRQ